MDKVQSLSPTQSSRYFSLHEAKAPRLDDSTSVQREHQRLSEKRSPAYDTNHIDRSDELCTLTQFSGVHVGQDWDHQTRRFGGEEDIVTFSLNAICGACCLVIDITLLHEMIY